VTPGAKEEVALAGLEIKAKIVQDQNTSWFEDAVELPQRLCGLLTGGKAGQDAAACQAGKSRDEANAG